VAAGSAAYRRVEVETATPEKLVVMLYNGAIRHVEDAKRTIALNDVRRTHDHLIRAQEIVTELRGALNFAAGDVAQNLDRIYDYVHRLLIQANLKKDAAPLDECLGHLRELRDAWDEIAARPQAGDSAAPAASHNAHGHVAVNLEG
jgi:flagellar protein FliS